MKSEVVGTLEFRDPRRGSRSTQAKIRSVCEGAAGGRYAARDYLRKRWNVIPWEVIPTILPPGCQPDLDSAISRGWVAIAGRPDYFQVIFTEGRATKAFVEAQDRKYLSEIAISLPDLFLKEMTPRAELSEADQALMLGLDLTLPHHQNLQREYAATVERLRGAVMVAPAPVPMLGAAAAAAAAPVPARPVAPAAAAAALPAPPLGGVELVPYSEIHLGRELGRGGFGVVYLATLREREVAVKKLLLPDLTAEAQVNFLAEANIMVRLRHPQIVPLLGVCLEPRNYCLVMEYLVGGSLFGLLHSDRPLSTNLILRIAKEIAMGLAFLHANRALHLDMKSLNVLLDAENHAKIGDFGLARIKTDSAHLSSVGFAGISLLWAPPESLRREPLTEASDAYSYGVVLWELLTRAVPFEGKTQDAIMAAIMANRRGELEKIPEATQGNLKAFVRRCLAMNPADRPPLSEAVTFFERAERAIPAGGAGAAAAAAALA